MKALLYLAVRRLVNSVRRIPGSPRLLLPILFFVLVFGLQLVAFFLAGGVRPTAEQGAPAFTPEAFIEGGPGALVAAVRGVLLISVFTSVVAAFGDGTLFFSPSDVDFLFPAPLRRRAVLLFKMAGTYASLLFPAVYIPFAVGGATAAEAGRTPLAYWPGMLGAWLFLLTAANLAQAALLNRAPHSDADGDEEDERRRARVRRLLTAARWALLAAVAYGLWYWIGDPEGADVRGLLRSVNSPSASALLFPIAWASDLFLVAFRGWQASDVGRLAGLLVLAAASFVLLFGRDRDFYEGAMDRSAKRLRTLTAMQSGNAGTILSQMAEEGKLAKGRTLPTFGGGARAVLWKDLVSVTRTPARSWITLLVIAAFPALFGRAFGGRGGEAGVLFWVFLFTLNMSSIFLLSLRDMLRRADIMKALPVAPARLLLAELGLSIGQLTLLGWASLGLMVLLGGGGAGPLTRVAFFVLPTLAAALLLVQTSFVMLYPNRNDQAQNTVSGLLSLLACVVALLPSVGVGVALYFADVPPFVQILGISLTNLVAAGAALAFAAFLWQRFDPTD